MTDILDSYELGLSFNQIDKFYKLCQAIDTAGNGGWYRISVLSHCSFILDNKMKPVRDGIIYYSRGHGWRVRKEPHWEAVMLARFPKWTEWRAKQIMDGGK